MNKFDKIKFNLTDDESVGLYSKDIGDIFHSKSGALKEAFEKFILPASNILRLAGSKCINVLDICYGVGYNTKSLLYNNQNISFNIDAIEIGSEFVYISPFIKDNISDDELKIFLISQILNSDVKIVDFLEVFSYFDINYSDIYFSSFIYLFKALFSDSLYNFIPSADNLSFLHNI